MPKLPSTGILSTATTLILCKSATVAQTKKQIMSKKDANLKQHIAPDIRSAKHFYRLRHAVRMFYRSKLHIKEGKYWHFYNPDRTCPTTSTPVTVLKMVFAPLSYR